MSSVTLDDYLEVYPEQDNPLITTYISKMKQFSELQPPLGTETGVFVDQEFARRFLVHYDRMLVWHQAGTGKTRLMIHSREYFRDTMRAFILTTGAILQTTIIEEIIKHTGQTYITQHVATRPDSESRQRALRKEIKKYYTIESYSDFAKRVQSMDAAALDRFMTDVIVYVDEAHSTSTLSDRRPGSASRDDAVYAQLHRAFHSGTNNKIVLLTATPMINEVQDYKTLIELIGPQVEYDMKTITIRELEPFVRGKVSYIRRPETGAVPVMMGEDIVTEQGHTIKVYKSVMSPEQRDLYLKAQSGDFEVKRLQISNFIFPNPDGPPEANLFSEYVVKDIAGSEDVGASRRPRTLRTGMPNLNPVNSQIFIDAVQNDLETYSPKFADILRIVSEKYYTGDEEIVPDNKGICFVYSEYVSIGAEILALVFKYNGYTAFTPSMLRRFRNGTLSKGRRFVIITGATPAKVASAAFSVLNSPENKFGEYLQLVIGSSVTGRGISIFNAVAMLFVTPQWNRTKEEQAKDRVFRATSFKDRIEYKIEHGLEPVLPVEIYRMASVFPDDNPRSVDERLYALSEDKSYEIARMIRMNKILAVDAKMNMRRNVQPTDLDYSEICNYMKCQYKPYLPKASQIQEDYAGKLKYFMEDEVVKVYEALEDIFSEATSLSITELSSDPRLRDMDRKYLLVALDQISHSHTPLKNRFGQNVYVREINDIFFTTENPYALSPSIGYNRPILSVNWKDERLDRFLDLKEEQKLADIMNVATEDELIKAIQEQRPGTKARLFEQAFKRIFDAQNAEGKDVSNFDTLIFDMFQPFIYTFTEPVAEINKAITNITSVKRGRRRNVRKGGIVQPLSTTPHLQFIPNRLDESDEQLIYIHDLNPMGVKQQAIPGFRAATGYMRVFKTTEGSWRDLNTVESTVYRKMISDYRKQVMNEIDRRQRDMGVYGIRLPGAELSIKQLKPDGTWTTGRLCSSLSSAMVDEIVGLLGINKRSRIVDTCIDIEREMRRRGMVFTGEIPRDIKLPRTTIHSAEIENIRRPVDVNLGPVQPVTLEELESEEELDLDIF